MLFFPCFRHWWYLKISCRYINDTHYTANRKRSFTSYCIRFKMVFKAKIDANCMIEFSGLKLTVCESHTAEKHFWATCQSLRISFDVLQSIVNYSRNEKKGCFSVENRFLSEYFFSYYIDKTDGITIWINN